MISDASHRAVPPVTPLAIASLALVVVGGIVMAAAFPRPPALGLPIALLAASALLLAAGLVLLARQPGFAWSTFRRVAGWALLAYVVSAGLIEFSFVHNHASGAPLLVVTLLLVMYALDVPLLIGFTVACYQTAASADTTQ
jgi:hypothetical protein